MRGWASPVAPVSSITSWKASYSNLNLSVLDCYTAPSIPPIPQMRFNMPSIYSSSTAMHSTAEGCDQVLWSTDQRAHWKWDVGDQVTGPNLPFTKPGVRSSFHNHLWLTSDPTGVPFPFWGTVNQVYHFQLSQAGWLYSKVEALI